RPQTRYASPSTATATQGPTGKDRCLASPHNKLDPNRSLPKRTQKTALPTPFSEEPSSASCSFPRIKDGDSINSANASLSKLDVSVKCASEGNSNSIRLNMYLVSGLPSALALYKDIANQARIRVRSASDALANIARLYIDSAVQPP